MSKKPWPQDRREELNDLRHLLSEVRALNTGDDVIGRMQRCIDLSRKLMAGDFADPRPSFLGFLTDEAYGDE